MGSPPSEPSDQGARGERGPWRAGLTRRAVLAGAAALGVGAGLDRALRPGSSVRASRPEAVPFYGVRQAGIATPQQRELFFAAFDLQTSSRPALRRLLERWTEAAAALSAGRPWRGPVGPGAGDPGEALGLPPSRLTLTFGVGPTLFERDGRDRFGLAHLRPPTLESLPPFAGEALDPLRSGGDLCVQACADDPQVVFHAVHVLARLAGGDASICWAQRGFWHSVPPGGPTPRNLLGFKDGTANIHADDREAMERFVWVQPSDRPAWMRHGTYLVARRIELMLESWDALPLAAQERAIGRYKASGAPLGGRHEHDAPDLGATDPHGNPLIPLDAHIRVAAPGRQDEQRILRRSYSYSAGNRGGPADRGGRALDAGLFFIAFVRDPARQFVPLQRRLATADALSAFTLHTASAVFACLPGVPPGGFLGQQLLAGA